MKWKHKKSGRVVEVIEDERGKRYYVWLDDAEQDIKQWDLVYGEAWTDSFEPVK